MDKIRCITFDPAAQEALPDHVKDKMKADRDRCRNKPEKWQKANKSPHDYPIGTKFKAITGGHWSRTSFGFKWFCGSTFPNVGGDWDGTVCLAGE